MFDATIQCIVGGYSNWPEYNKYLEQSCNLVFVFIKTLYITGVTQKAYNARAAIMNRIIAPKCDVLDCAMNISSLILKLMHDVPSLECTNDCNNCGLKKTISPVLQLNTIPFYKQGMKGLQEAVDQCSKIKNLICNRCNSRDIKFSCNGGYHVFIDIECLENEQLASRVGYPDSSRKYILAELPNEIFFCENQYKLVAAVRYIPGEKIGHYVAYVRKITGRWQKYDGISIDKKPCLIIQCELLDKKVFIYYFTLKTKRNPLQEYLVFQRTKTKMYIYLK